MKIMADQLFHKTEYQVQQLVDMTNKGELGLPDLQRGFVWKPNKIRDLLDSMMKGYPIGFVMLWAAQSNTAKGENKVIGKDDKIAYGQDYVIIDGQQRITSLYAVMTGKEISEGGKFIKISFNPITKEFAVWNMSTERNPEWISNISDIYINVNRSRAFINKFIDNLKEYREKREEVLTEDDEQLIDESISEVLKLRDYPINALVINGDVDEESVADIFTRVNSGGVKLNENDFIMTLISVSCPELRDKIESFCEESTDASKGGKAYNKLIAVKPQQIIRTTMAFTFKRARLKYAYMKLRGSDLKRGADGRIDMELRKQSFTELADGLNKVLDYENWNEFIRTVMSAGFVNSSMISSENALVYSYMMFLIGKYQFDINSEKLRKIIAKWYYMASTTSHYTGSFESTVQEELNDIDRLNSEDEFENYIDSRISLVFTNDYFTHTIPDDLNSSASTSAVWNTYLAALNILNVKVLFSDLYYNQLLTGDFNGTRTALEKHHLFPKAYLERIGIKDDRDRNQIANFAYIEWGDNMTVGDDAPSEYFKEIFDRKIDKNEQENAMKYNALPEKWYDMSYKDFLTERRKLMSNVIKEGYEKLNK
jgi:hypothetical protein